MDISAIGMMQYQNINCTPKTIPSAEDEKLKETCRDFESIFIKQMLDSMEKTVNRSGLIDGGYAEKIYQDMLYDEYAQEMAKTANLGIADMMYKQLSHTPS